MTIYFRMRNIAFRLINGIRLLDLKMSGAKIDANLRIFGRFSWVGAPENIEIGSSCTINEGVFINARDRIVIGKNVHLSPGVQLHTGGLAIDKINRHHVKAPITIEDGVWLASGVIVSKGVRIGKNSVVGANSVVTNDIPAFSFYAGIPAQFIRNIQTET